MLTIEELDPNNPRTHKVLKEDDVISPGEAKWFRRELERIAGTNPHGKPKLQMVWGPTHEDPMQIDRLLKYVDFATELGVAMGERRWIIEVWRSPEFLVKSGRYQATVDAGTIKDFHLCASCHADLFFGPNGLEKCTACGSGRSYLRQLREDGGGKLLCDFPGEGCYDYWLRLERANFTYHAPDNEALKIIRALWEWELTPQNRRDALEQSDRELERRQMILEQRRQSGTVPQFGSELILPRHLQRMNF